MIVTLSKMIPSNSHNAPFSEEHGEHWPAGQRFKLLDERRQKAFRKHSGVKATSTVVEQIGGEEVQVSIPNDRFEELFGIVSPYEVATTTPKAKGFTTKCRECGRVFDMLNEADAAEFSAGHDCEC